MQPDQEAKPALSADEQMIQDGFNALLQDYLNSNHRRKVERLSLIHISEPTRPY